MSYSMLRDIPMRMRRCRKRKSPLIRLAPRTLAAEMVSFDQVICIPVCVNCLANEERDDKTGSNTGEDTEDAERQLELIIPKVKRELL